MNLIVWFLANSGVYFFYELVAAVFSTYFYYNYSKDQIDFKWIMVFLWWTWFADTFAKYSPLLYLNNYQFLDVRHTIFERNGWVYNLVVIVSIAFYSWFFYKKMTSIKIQKFIIYTASFAILYSVFTFYTSDLFWIVRNPEVSLIRGILIILFCVFYFFELLKSDRFISFYKYFDFYFVIGVFVFYLITTPLFIYSKYFTWDSYDFSMLQIFIVKCCNVVLYSLCIVGYLISMKYKNLNLKFY